MLITVLFMAPLFPDIVMHCTAPNHFRALIETETAALVIPSFTVRHFTTRGLDE